VKKPIVFDLDGTLAESKSPIDAGMFRLRPKSEDRRHAEEGGRQASWLKRSGEK
jgi:FMN phosphatase YigB (HAD superfamily)